MTYRTRTYIAADWTGDSDAVKILHDWNDNNHLTLSFTDAHDLTQSSDTSLPCSIKKSLKSRMDASKIFVLIVGEHTNSLTKGSCSFCGSYNSWNYNCARRYSVDYRSYIKYECDKALEAGIKIVVLYKDTVINKYKCPESVRNEGKHVAMICRKSDGKRYWDYQSVKKALEE